jgi:hypothetical protein
MNRLAKFVVTFTTVALMSGSAFAAINYSEDFETYTVAPGDGLLHGGWKVFANVFGDYPGCSAYLYGYGPFDAPNSFSAFSNINEDGSSGLALTAFSNYDDAVHANSNCLESSVFQEVIFDAGDAGEYTFSFDTELPPTPLGPGVTTYAFVKVINNVEPWNTLLFESVPTTTAGRKSIIVTLTSTDHGGKILQWGFSNTASNYETSGRWYDNLSFAPRNTGSYQGEEGVPIPLWALILMGGLLALVGGSMLRRRKA